MIDFYQFYYTLYNEVKYSSVLNYEGIQDIIDDVNKYNLNQNMVEKYGNIIIESQELNIYGTYLGDYRIRPNNLVENYSIKVNFDDEHCVDYYVGRGAWSQELKVIKNIEIEPISNQTSSGESDGHE